MAGSTAPITVLITGANRGIGLCVLRRLLLAFPTYNYIVAVRDSVAGHTALEDLRGEGVLRKSHQVSVITLDVTSPDSITRTAEAIKDDFDGRLDILINNAGIAMATENENDLHALQKNWSETFRVNVFAPHLIFQAFLPFLIKSEDPRVINVSSGRASLERSSSNALPPTAVIPYSVSKAALNSLGIEMEKILRRHSENNVRVWSINPGHCKTAFNGYRGTRDPKEGARVVEVLLQHDRDGNPVESGFWEEKDNTLNPVPW